MISLLAEPDHARRVEDLRSALAERGIPALIVTDPPDIRWVTRFTGQLIGFETHRVGVDSVSRMIGGLTHRLGELREGWEAAGRTDLRRLSPLQRVAILLRCPPLGEFQLNRSVDRGARRHCLGWQSLQPASLE